MKNLAKPWILDVKPYVPGKPIEEVKRELKIKEVIKLASNENPYGPSPRVRRSIADAAVSLNRYPASDCFYLRQYLSQTLKVNPNQLIFGNGSDEVIVFAIRAFVNSGDEVIVAKPSFLIYDIATRIEGGIVVDVPLLHDFSYDLNTIKKSITSRTKIIFIGNPDNPGGQYLSHEVLRSFLKSIPKNVIVFIDEAYFEYVEKKDYGNSILLLKAFKNVVVSRTFSKMYGLAGLRIGYAAANEEMIDILNRVREPFNINSLAQEAALACLKDKPYYKKISQKFKQQREYLYSQFEKLGLEYVKSFTNFILVKINGTPSDFCQKLLKKGVIVRDMSFWGLNSYIRITIGTEQENKKLINVLGGII